MAQPVEVTCLPVYAVAKVAGMLTCNTFIASTNYESCNMVPIVACTSPSVGGRLLHKGKHHADRLTCIGEGMTGALKGLPAMGAACVAPTQAEEPLSWITKPQ